MLITFRSVLDIVIVSRLFSLFLSLFPFPTLFAFFSQMQFFLGARKKKKSHAKSSINNYSNQQMHNDETWSYLRTGFYSRLPWEAVLCHFSSSGSREAEPLRQCRGPPRGRVCLLGSPWAHRLWKVELNRKKENHTFPARTDFQSLPTSSSFYTESQC